MYSYQPITVGVTQEELAMAHGFKAKKDNRYKKDGFIDYAKNMRNLRGMHDPYFSR
jgi:hypothetical protein